MKRNKNYYQDKINPASPNLQNNTNTQQSKDSYLSPGAPKKNVSGVWVLLVFVILIVAVFLLGWLTQ
jgi:hypothetical protein